MSGSFAHLHVHTEYSLLDGASRIDDLVRLAAADGQPGLAITDHGNLHGAWEFVEACQQAELKALVGYEAYLAHDKADGRERDPHTGDLHYHMTLIAINQTGYRNLMGLATYASRNGFYHKPRIDLSTLAEHNDGLVATTGCLSSRISRLLLNDQRAAAKQHASDLRDIFGRDRLFVELQDHGIPEQRQIDRDLRRLARGGGLRTVATNDSHYTHQTDAAGHDALLCVQTNSKVSDTDRFRFHGDQHYFKTAAEMRNRFDTESCDTTLQVIDIATNLQLPLTDVLQLPKVNVPPQFATAADWLKHQTRRGAARRWGDPVPPHIRARLVHEIAVIGSCGFDDYFLLTADLCREARRRDIRIGPGRGSVAGSAVAYCLGITSLDPLEHKLLFERFLHTGRVGMPDIDLDVASHRRDELVDYLAEQYGHDHVAKIVQFSRIRPKTAVRDACRVLGYPADVGNRTAGLIPDGVAGRPVQLRHVLERTADRVDEWRAGTQLRQLQTTDNRAAHVLEVALTLDGLVRQTAVHPGGVVVADTPVGELVPLMRNPTDGSDGLPLTQFDLHGVERAHLLKLDLLGSRYQDIIARCEQHVRQHNPQFRVDALPLDDATTYKLLADGQTVGVFQLESDGMIDLLDRVQPTRFDHLAACQALYRPGPLAANMHRDYADRKNGRVEVRYPHPDAETILADTYGLMIYQEQAMQIAQQFAGYTPGEADMLRKAIGKKRPDVMAAESGRFQRQTVERGYTAELAGSLWHLIEAFADYGFNRSHSYAYALVCYQSAYLKTHHTVDYMAAQLELAGSADRAALLLRDCRLSGVQIRRPDINRSQVSHTPDHSNERGHVLIGLGGVRGVVSAAAVVVDERAAGGPFRSLDDFRSRIPAKLVNRNALISLIHAGAFDELGEHRLQMVRDTETAGRSAQPQIALFGATPTPTAPPPAAEYSHTERAHHELVALGVSLTDHPLDYLAPLLDKQGGVACDKVPRHGPPHETVHLQGAVTRLARPRSKYGNRYLQFQLEGRTGADLRVLGLGKLYAQCDPWIDDRCVVAVRGTLDRHDNTIKANHLELLAHPLDRWKLTIHVPTGDPAANTRHVDFLARLVDEHPGDTAVELRPDRVRWTAQIPPQIDIRHGAISSLLKQRYRLRLEQIGRVNT